MWQSFVLYSYQYTTKRIINANKIANTSPVKPYPIKSNVNGEQKNTLTMRRKKMKMKNKSILHEKRNVKEKRKKTSLEHLIQKIWYTIHPTK
jgi:aconitase A